MQGDGRGYYQTLGITKDASESDIKKAYRKLALRWHPDKNKTENSEMASEKFKMVSEAYSVLSDPSKRRAYDRSGGLNFEDMFSGGDRSSTRTYHNHQDFTFQNADDIFRQFFGGHDPFENLFTSGFGNSRGFEDEFFSRASSGGLLGSSFGGSFGGHDAGSFMHMGSHMGSHVSSHMSMGSSGGFSCHSTSSSTTIGPDGRRVTHTTVSRTLPDGSVEKTTTTSTNDGSSRRLTQQRGATNQATLSRSGPSQNDYSRARR
eukprot:GHVH01007964.1.p1 GENE.GHVH01007964.1~~GHVH01007964.1.p1  ORF type:complete len:261 (+),score=24.46 GHVH01007964.1:541-1323(+)